jgi:hypothetical protein
MWRKADLALILNDYAADPNKNEFVKWLRVEDLNAGAGLRTPYAEERRR